LKEKYLTDLIKSILAGSAIAIGAIIFVLLGGGIAGAFVFSIGIYLVLWYGLNLYTGKIGYVTSYKEIPKILLIIIGNAIGACLALMVQNEFVNTIVLTKLSIPLYLVFIKAVICGILIYAGVDQYKKGHQFAPLIAIPAFILAGAEHSIADICFFLAARQFSIEGFVFIIIVIIGNAIGSLLWRKLT
jgi:formate/nitrite transporter FocA (FNT family)